MPDQPHDHPDTIRRLADMEKRVNDLRYVSPDLLEAKLDTIREIIGNVRADVIDLQAAEQQRKTQMYTVIGALIILLVGGLLQSGVFG